MLPVVVGMDGLVILNAPFSDGETTFKLLVDQNCPFGHHCMMKLLFCVHEIPPLSSRESRKMYKLRVAIWSNHLMSVVVLERYS